MGAPVTISTHTYFVRLVDVQNHDLSGPAPSGTTPHLTQARVYLYERTKGKCSWTGEFIVDAEGNYRKVDLVAHKGKDVRAAPAQGGSPLLSLTDQRAGAAVENFVVVAGDGPRAEHNTQLTWKQAHGYASEIEKHGQKLTLSGSTVKKSSSVVLLPVTNLVSWAFSVRKEYWESTRKLRALHANKDFLYQKVMADQIHALVNSDNGKKFKKCVNATLVEAFIKAYGDQVNGLMKKANDAIKLLASKLFQPGAHLRADYRKQQDARAPAARDSLYSSLLFGLEDSEAGRHLVSAEFDTEDSTFNEAMRSTWEIGKSTSEFLEVFTGVIVLKKKESAVLYVAECLGEKLQLKPEKVLENILVSKTQSVHDIKRVVDGETKYYSYTRKTKIAFCPEAVEKLKEAGESGEIKGLLRCLAVIFLFQDIQEASKDPSGKKLAKLAMDSAELVGDLAEGLLNKAKKEGLAGTESAEGLEMGVHGFGAIASIIGAVLEGFEAWDHYRAGNPEGSAAHATMALGCAITAGFEIYAIAAGVSATGVGAPIGVALLIVGLVWSIFADDSSTETWLKHTCFGTHYGKDEEGELAGKSVSFAEWKGNYVAQLESMLVLFVGFTFLPSAYEGKGQLVLEPTILLESSKVYVQLTGQSHEANAQYAEAQSDATSVASSPVATQLANSSSPLEYLVPDRKGHLGPLDPSNSKWGTSSEGGTSIRIDFASRTTDVSSSKIVYDSFDVNWIVDLFGDKTYYLSGSQTILAG